MARENLLVYLRASDPKFAELVTKPLTILWNRTIVPVSDGTPLTVGVVVAGWIVAALRGRSPDTFNVIGQKLSGKSASREPDRKCGHEIPVLCSSLRADRSNQFLIEKRLDCFVASVFEDENLGSRHDEPKCWDEGSQARA